MTVQPKDARAGPSDRALTIHVVEAEPSPLDRSEPDVHTRGLGPRSTSKEAGCDSGLCSPCFLLLPAAWKVSEFSKWLLATFHPASGRGQGWAASWGTRAAALIYHVLHLPGPGLCRYWSQGSCHSATGPAERGQGRQSSAHLLPDPSGPFLGNARGDTKVCV